jgi:hypothetical protein
MTRQPEILIPKSPQSPAIVSPYWVSRREMAPSIQVLAIAITASALEQYLQREVEFRFRFAADAADSN